MIKVEGVLKVTQSEAAVQAVYRQSFAFGAFGGDVVTGPPWPCFSLIKAVHVLGEAAMQAVWDGVREPQLADRAGLDVVTWTCVCSVHACMPHMRTNAWHACTMHAPCMHYARTMHV